MRVKGQVPHSCQRKSLLAVCVHKVTARFQQPLKEWRGRRGEVHPCYHSSAQWSPFWVPGSQLLSGDYVQKHSSSLENEVSWRIRHRLKAGGVIQEGDKDREPTAVTGDRSGRLGAGTGLPGVLLGWESLQLGILKWSSCGVKPTEGFAWPCLLAGLEVSFLTQVGGGRSLKGSATSCIWTKVISLLFISSQLFSIQK